MPGSFDQQWWQSMVQSKHHQTVEEFWLDMGFPLLENWASHFWWFLGSRFRTKDLWTGLFSLANC
jgi:hypothetical protein